MGSQLLTSHLSDSRYGYDFVVATTQESINGTMLAFLDSASSKPVDACFVMSDRGECLRIAADEVVRMTGGIDPFTIPDHTDPKDARILALLKARFVGGFRARIGLPSTDRPELLPDIVTLGQDVSQVIFRAMCSEFTVVALQANVYGPPLSWVCKSQLPEKPWVFVADVKLENTIMNIKEMQSLPADVQQKISALQGTPGAEFDIKHLLLDLANAATRSAPRIDGLEDNSPIQALLGKAFMDVYLHALTENGEPVLGCMAVARKTASTPSQVVTGLHLMVNPYVGPDGLPVAEPTVPMVKCTTLNYLCTWGQHTLPPPHRFSWNWVSVPDLSDRHGVVSINRSWLVAQFTGALTQFVAKSCLQPNVQCDLTSSSSVSYSCEFPSLRSTPAVLTSAPDPKVITFAYKVKDQDQCGLNGCLGQLELRYEYGLAVTLSGNTITVEQTQLAHVFIQRMATNKSGNYLNQRMVDTYSVGVNQQGQLVLQRSSKITDNSTKIPDDSSIAPSSKIRDIVNKVRTKAPLVPSILGDVVLSNIENFVFPAGRSFHYSSAEFSNHQDLVCCIRYAGPGHGLVKIPRRG